MATVIDGVSDEQMIYKILLDALTTKGERLSPRGQPTLMLPNVVIVHEDPGDVLLTGLGRGLSPGLLALEPLQLVGGFSNPDLTVKIVPHYANFMDNGSFWGAYGERTGRYMRQVVDRFDTDTQTRQAQVNFWDNDLDLEFQGKHDYPCTVTAHFEVGPDGRLNGTTVMRSNDAWLGYPYDVVQHACLLKTLARFMHIPVGTYTHIVHNMHLYERDLEKALALRDKLHLHAERPRLDGGIGSGDEWRWSAVQERARALADNPCSIMPATSEEEWYQQSMLAAYEKIGTVDAEQS